MTQEPVEEVEPEILKPRKFGGRQPGSGRPKGSPNKIAHQYGPGALKELARIATQGESEATRVAACRDILDRAYGKANTRDGGLRH
jgi:hypothetical protein